MLMRRHFVSIVLLCAMPAAHLLRAQASTESAPVDNYLLEITQRWGKESALGDTRAVTLPSDGLELRVWGGYGLTATRGIIIRRSLGAWRGWAAEVHTCSLAVPIPVADTASEITAAKFRERARRECGQEHADTLLGASIFSVDTLETHEIRDAPALMRAWESAVKAGALTLPPEIKRSWVMLDGFGYVVEVRRGQQYRASVIEHVQTPEAEADRQVQAVYRAVLPLLQAAFRRSR